MPNGNTVPVPGGVIKTGTLRGIVKESGLSMPEFLSFL
jgi:predicted RNA binding protein YcfA (HicA-like mRNA interferase family)